MNWWLGFLFTVSSSSAFALCEVRTVSNDSSFDFRNQVTRVKIELSMSPDCSLDWIAKSIDPQNWSKCAPETFLASYITTNSNSTIPIENAPAPGSNWAGTLFEDVEDHSVPRLASRVQNLLWFRIFKMPVPNESGEYYRADYGIQKSLPSVLLGLSYKSVLDLDNGYISVTKSSNGHWKFVGVKSVHYQLNNGHFVDPLMSTAANLYARAAVKGLVQTITDKSFSCFGF